MRELSKGRISIQVSTRFLNDHHIYDALKDAGIETCDLWYGQTLYKGNVEEMVKITVHETDFAQVFKLWRELRRNVPGVDCARVYYQDKDWCAKQLYSDLVRDGGLK